MQGGRRAFRVMPFVLFQTFMKDALASPNSSDSARHAAPAKAQAHSCLSNLKVRPPLSQEHMGMLVSTCQTRGRAGSRSSAPVVVLVVVGVAVCGSCTPATVHHIALGRASIPQHMSIGKPHRQHEARLLPHLAQHDRLARGDRHLERRCALPAYEHLAAHLADRQPALRLAVRAPSTLYADVLHLQAQV